MNCDNIVLYTNGDSVSWGAELLDRSKRFSTLLSKEKGWFDLNVASAGISNDRIYRTTIRDITKFLNKQEIYGEEVGHCNVEKIFVLISFTSPTRVDYFDGDVFKTEQLWYDKDKWGEKDAHKTTINPYIVNNAKPEPAFTRLFNQIISLDSFLTLHKIPHFFTNAFFLYNEDEFDAIKYNVNQIKVLSQFDDPNDYFGLKDLYKHVPNSYKEINLLKILREKNNTELFAPRGHPSEQGHYEIFQFLKDIVRYE